MERRDCVMEEGNMERAGMRREMEVRKGSWSAEEDEILVSYVKKYGHSNWRALPKLAGLSRCGKSCRLRWMNYLRPGIKRGNFTDAEKETIIALHEQLGNRWSAIAARLPGRTDNEIKNVWHTHLKKRERRDYQSDDASREVSDTVDAMKEDAIPWDEFIESWDITNLTAPVDHRLDFWRRLLLAEDDGVFAIL